MFVSLSLNGLAKRNKLWAQCARLKAMLRHDRSQMSEKYKGIKEYIVFYLCVLLYYYSYLIWFAKIAIIFSGIKGDFQNSQVVRACLVGSNVMKCGVMFGLPRSTVSNVTNALRKGKISSPKKKLWNKTKSFRYRLSNSYVNCSNGPDTYNFKIYCRA